MARPAVTAELFKVALVLGRGTWYASLAFGLLAVLLAWRENRIHIAAIWWVVLAGAVLLRLAYCQRALRHLSQHPRKLPPQAQWYAIVAALEGVVWAMLLVLLPSATDFGLRFQLGLTLLVMLGVLLPFAPAGLPWVAFGIPVGFAQLVVLISRELPQHDLLLLTWSMTMAGAALTAQWLKRALSNNLSLRHRADLSAKAQEQANAELNRSREQLRLALDAIDAGIADNNLITGERFYSARYLSILGHDDRDRFHKEHRLSDALHPEDRKRVMEARRRHTDSGALLREECRMRRADGTYVWVILRGESVRGTDGRPTRLVLSIVDTTEKRIAEHRLIDSERRYRALVEASPSLIWICDDKGKLTFVSDRACRDMFGAEPRELMGKHVADFTGPGFTRREFLRRFSPAMHGRPVFEMEAILRDVRGQPLSVNVSALPILNASGQIESVTGVCTDITAAKQRERELNIALRNQQAIFDAAGEGIVFVRNARIEGPNRALARMLGVTREALVGQPVEEILAARSDWETIDQATRAAAVRGEAAIHEVMLRANDGRNVWCQLTSRQAGDGGAYILVLTDITSLKRREELAWHQANHDDLTGLPNRRQLGEHARRLLSVALKQRRLAAVLVLDLDGFKEINDLFGHSYGDGLLKRVALRLSGVLRDYDVVARTGGDEFVVLLPEIEQPSVAMVVAEKLIAAASENVEHLGRSLRLHASVGVALFPGDGQDFETLLAAADSAMYAAKAAGKNRYQLAAETGHGRHEALRAS
ncbi:MAG TPA: diguanylate cyclase [Burkholderiaceae bacterium]|nr:diguanylate cyclase [Burkholderiaceae bacterium]HQR76449.1 diguanylate cyclase [Burkholderiaceae bacterium]